MVETVENTHTMNPCPNVSRMIENCQECREYTSYVQQLLSSPEKWFLGDQQVGTLLESTDFFQCECQQTQMAPGDFV